jgi:GTP-binding protein EngB required for normal cell division
MDSLSNSFSKKMSFSSLTRKNSKGGGGDTNTTSTTTTTTTTTTKFHTKKGSLDKLIGDIDILEAPLAAKTDLIDELSTLWPLNNHVKAPGIIVVGAREAGKSSLIYSLTGVNLPHNGPQGSTKRPLKLQICADPTAKSPYALVNADHPPMLKEEAGTRLVSKLDDLGKVIITTAGEEEGAIGEEDRSHPIYIKLVRPAGTAYTVVDLPGVDEKDSESVRIAEQYLKEEGNALILCVLPIGDVFERAFPVRLAKRVDPEGRRTIGVVTKADLVEKDMEAVEKLQMTSQRDVSLPLG